MLCTRPCGRDAQARRRQRQSEQIDRRHLVAFHYAGAIKRNPVHQALRNSSGSLAILLAILRASSCESSLAYHLLQ
jgi:hypothetical protein